MFWARVAHVTDPPPHIILVTEPISNLWFGFNEMRHALACCLSMARGEPGRGSVRMYSILTVPVVEAEVEDLPSKRA